MGEGQSFPLSQLSLARNQKAIRTSALHMGFSPDLVWLIGELGSAPLAYHLQHLVLGSDPRNGTGVRPHDWLRGYCPFCGSWPAFIEAHGGKRALRCSYCALEWAPASNSCVYCGNAGGDFVGRRVGGLAEEIVGAGVLEAHPEAAERRPETAPQQSRRLLHRGFGKDAGRQRRRDVREHLESRVGKRADRLGPRCGAFVGHGRNLGTGRLAG